MYAKILKNLEKNINKLVGKQFQYCKNFKIFSSKNIPNFSKVVLIIKSLKILQVKKKNIFFFFRKI